MVKYSVEVFGYVPREVKTRLKRIKELDRDRTESSIITRGLMAVLPEVEKELGISQPVQRPRSRKAV